ncbi:MAG: hypothetical protein JW803_05770 [Endomicrobiales bacterium]|nr:hypothetical protein [Endomicrobiales bacterium]
MVRLTGLTGIVVFLGIAFLLSENRRRINWATVLWGFALQLAFAVFILKTFIGKAIFDFARIAFDAVLSFSDRGASFVFGNLPKDLNIGAVIAFKVLPIIIFVSSLMGILYYYGIIQFFVKIAAKIMRRSMKTSGAESVGTALLIFMGIESVTAIRTYISQMTRSELFTVMTAFMATIASSVMATYASFGAEPGHLLAASIMSAPGAVLLSKVIIPEVETPKTADVRFDNKTDEHNVIEAAANGASVGLNLALQIGAMLIAFVSLLWMINALFGLFGTSFENIMGIIYWPFAVVMGVPPSEASVVGDLLGTRTVFNEFLAYLKLKDLVAQGVLSPKSVVISTYALCGFANFGSLAILIGGIGAISPGKKGLASSLGIKSIVAGTLACFITACVAGVLN